jgi:disulfide bond formation protein DsbB
MTRSSIRLLIEKSLSMPTAALLLLLVNIGALFFALTMQYGFGVSPCNLCLWARIPYASVAVLSFLTLIWTPYRRQTALLFGLCVLAYLIGMGIAIFHTGVEQHWWLGPTSCSAEILQGSSAEELRRALLQIEEPRCDEIPWTIFGFSLANLNIPASFALAVFAFAAAFRHARKK